MIAVFLSCFWSMNVGPQDGFLGGVGSLLMTRQSEGSGAREQGQAIATKYEPKANMSSLLL